MARAKIGQKEKAARHKRASRDAKWLNDRLPPYVYAYVTQHGKLVVYYQEPRKSRVRLRSEPFTPDWDVELAAAKRGEPLVQVPPAQPNTDAALPRSGSDYPEGTLGWLLNHYFDNGDHWRRLSDQTRRKADLLKTLVIEHPDYPGSQYGYYPLRLVTAQDVLTLLKVKIVQVTAEDVITGEARTLERNAEAANQRRKWLMPVLQHGVMLGKLAHNFVRDVPKFKNDKISPDEADGWPTWPEWLCRAYEHVHQPGTLARLVYDIALWTLARKSDLPRLGAAMLKQSRKGVDMLVYWQHKGRNRAPVKAYAPMFPELERALQAAREAGILGKKTYIVQKPGTDIEKAYGADSLGNYMQDWVDTALRYAGREHPPGPKGYSLHGIRKAGICQLILGNKITDRMIMAISGHRDRRMIDLYAKEYMREYGAEKAYMQWVQTQKTPEFDEEEFEQEYLEAA